MFFAYTSRVLRGVEESNLTDITDKMISIIDSEISKLNMLSLNITGSSLLKENISDFHSLTAAGYPRESTEVYLAARDITRMLAMISGPVKAVPQINFIVPGSLLIGSGTYNLIHDIPGETAAAFSGIDSNYGKRHFSRTIRDPLAEEAFPMYKNQNYISLYRTIFDEHKKESIGIIEVKQFAETIFYGPSKAPRNFMIFDSDYNQLFPVTVGTSGTYTEMLKNNRETGITAFRNPATEANEIISIGKCREINWTILNIAQEQDILKPVYRFLLIITVSGLVMFIISISVARRLSSLITQSLMQLNGWITNLHWNNLSAETPADLEILSPLLEFEEIHQEFWKMNRKLADSMKLVVQERSLQENARMLALQSQMDPHFMYNMLTTIGIMAEEGESDNIVETIDRLTSILRYTASRSRLSVPLSEEVLIAENYLKCMKIRFDSDLSYRISIDDRLQDFVIPKLVILPLVENSIKYATNGEPPWTIDVEASVKNNGSGERWEIIVRDTGPGFSDEALEKINNMINCCTESAENQLNFHFDGLGLPNIYSRMMMVQENFNFEMYNSDKAGGACIRFGGPLGKNKI